MPNMPHTIAVVAVLLCSALIIGASCNNGRTQPSNEADATTTDGSDRGCHDVGELFPPPSGITDPWRLKNDIDTYCCSEDAQSIVIATTPEGGECQRSDPMQFVCLQEAGDDVCSPEENFCTSPLDCSPPSDAYPLCCREGVQCGTSPDDETGVDGCCNGLELVPYSVQNNQGDCITAPSGGLCVQNCGDGQCTLAENRCNCPQDCHDT